MQDFAPQFGFPEGCHHCRVVLNDAGLRRGHVPEVLATSWSCGPRRRRLYWRLRCIDQLLLLPFCWKINISFPYGQSGLHSFFVQLYFPHTVLHGPKSVHLSGSGQWTKNVFKGIVSRDFVVCFLVSIDRSDISTHQEWVLLLLKVRFHVEFFYIRIWA
jgi:hypothetical protein